LQVFTNKNKATLTIFRQQAQLSASPRYLLLLASCL